MSFSVLMMTDDFYLIRQYNRQRGAQGLGGSNKTKPREILNMNDLRNQGSTNTRNLRILHLMNWGYWLWTWSRSTVWWEGVTRTLSPYSVHQRDN